MGTAGVGTLVVDLGAAEAALREGGGGGGGTPFAVALDDISSIFKLE